MKSKAKNAVLARASSSVGLVDDAIDRLFNQISTLITAARERVAVGVNTELTKLNWNVGNCINREILGRGRAEYGKQIVKGLASRLMLIHGSGWDEKSLRHCLRAAETFGEDEIVSATRRQLSWTHIKTLACRGRSDVMTMPQLAVHYNGICHDRFIIVDQKETFWKMRRRNAHAFRRGDSAKAEPEGRTSVRGASLKDAGRLTFAAAKMGAEIIPRLLESIRKATSERREYGKGKKSLWSVRELQRQINSFYYERLLENRTKKRGDNPPIGIVLCTDKRSDLVRYTLPLHNKRIFAAKYKLHLPSEQELIAELRRERTEIEDAQLVTKLDAGEINRIKKSAYAKSTADRSAFDVGENTRDRIVN